MRAADSDVLDGASAILTGAASGVGEATTPALTEEGARAALAARRTGRVGVDEPPVRPGGRAAYR